MQATVRAAMVLLLLLASFGASAGDKITIIVAGIEKQIYLPAKLAEQLGYLKETGLDIELLSESAGVHAETELLSGGAHGVIGFYDHTIDLQARGKRVQSVVQLSLVPGEVLLVSKSMATTIQSPADFRGHIIGVTGLGSSTNFLTQYLAGMAGIKSTEFRTLPIGAGSSFINAMEQGKVHAGMTTEPTASRLLRSGSASLLVDLRNLQGTEAALGGPYPGACLYMPSAWVDTHRQEVQKIVSAFVKALKFIHSHSAAEIANYLPPAYFAANKQLYIEALDASKQMFTADGVMPEGGPATVLKVLQSVDKPVKGKSINLANTYTVEFARAAK